MPLLFYELEIVSFLDAHEERVWGHSWFSKLCKHVIICIDLYWHTCGHVTVHTTKKTL